MFFPLFIIIEYNYKNSLVCGLHLVCGTAARRNLEAAT